MIFNLPDLGEGLPEAEIHEWHVKEGDVVKVDDVMVSMETAKAVVEVPAPQSGKITKLHGKPGDIIKTGNPLVEFESDVKSTAVKKDSGTVVGNVVVGDIIITENATGVTPIKKQSGTKVLPAVRALARKLKVDLNAVKGTGASGMITSKDIENASQQSTLPEDYEEIKGVRRSMAHSMAKSHAEVVPVTISDDADIYAWPAKSDITIRVIRALTAACKAEPTLNTWFNGKALGRKVHDAINIGIAMDSGEGLFVPVLKDAANRGTSELRADINRFKTEVKDRSISPDDLKDFTIMLSNFGTFAGRYANPVVVPPCVAILGTGKIRDEVVAANNEAAIHRVMPLSLTFDHRAVTGGEAARFLEAVIDDLEKAK